ncbi:DUF5667 domain-containing protein [Bacillus sp. SCS-153A]|uniref:DUF5667 domain-containing protein n=1 Tax=Rossellomorea sedimentorum TaxID=3115294 RepID=UPI003906B799
MSKLSRTSLALLAAGTVSFSTTFVHANENDTETFEKVEFKAETEDATNVIVNDETVVQEETMEKESPSLVPGDFFYFVKVALEKIKLALTDDDKEAKLLAEFASERLAEAQKLFDAGEEEKAIETIEKALETMEEAEAEEAIEEESAENDEASDQDVSDKEGTEVEEVEEVEDGQTEEAAAEDGEEAINEVKEILAQNIIALQAALDKVNNPVAKAALQKNIEKTYKKFAVKLAELEEELENVEQENITDPLINDSEDKEEGSETVEAEEAEAAPVVVPSLKKVEKEQEKAASKQAKAEVKEEEAQKKADKKLEKIEQKQERAEEKAERKKERAEEKAERKKERAEEKAERKKERAEEKAERKKERAEEKEERKKERAEERAER